MTKSANSRLGRQSLCILHLVPSTIFIVIFTSLILTEFTEASEEKEIIFAEIGKNITIKCISENKNVTWSYNDEPLLFPNKRFFLNIKDVISDTDGNAIEEKKNVFEYSITINKIKKSDGGSYKCQTNVNDTFKIFLVQPFVEPKIIESNNAREKQKIGHAVTLFCLIEAYPQNDSFHKQLKWLKDESSFDFLDKSTIIKQINSTHVNNTLELAEVYKKENGSYACVVYGTEGEEVARRSIDLLVMDVPQVNIDYVKAVGASRIYLNWTLNDGNDPIQKFFIQYMQDGSPIFDFYDHIIGGKNTSYVLENFIPNSSYLLRLSAKNSIGEGVPHQYPQSIRTLQEDPIFIPKVKTTGSTSSTITIGWDPPPSELLEFIQYYELEVSEAGDVPEVVEATVYHQNSRNLPYMFDNLKTATEYYFKVRACSELTKLCGPWSEIVNGTTMDGVASKPTDLQVMCIPHNMSGINSNSILVTWNLPDIPNGKVQSYHITLDGVSTYKLGDKMHNEVWGPKVRRVAEPLRKAIYEGVNPNTNYTVTVAAITRHKKVGELVIGKCTMPVTVPESINRATWNKVKTTDSTCIFKVFLPKISERNGPICCYRLYLVRRENSKNELPPPEKLDISTYNEVHSTNNTFGGAYIAEMFSGNNFRSEIFLGDGKRFIEIDGGNLDKNDNDCRKCLGGKPFLRKHTFELIIPTSTETPQNIPVYPELSQRQQLNKASNLTEAASKILDNKRRRRRNPKIVTGESAQTISSEAEQPTYAHEIVSLKAFEEVLDGPLDMNSNYTGFLEVIVRDGHQILTAFSNYFETITPGTEAEQFDTGDDLSLFFNIALQLSAALFVVILILIVALCFLHYNTKNSASGEEVISLRDSLRALFGGRTGNHRHFIGTTNAKISDIGPIHKTDLYTAYKNRHKDTDYGFLREYEMLPNRFSDRTTKNSDMKENTLKNRYPDIKAYDQTRVKLSQLNGIQGSDYINANFVIGYKERKKFICAQGPMESTINDFWRMIWEQHLEIIVMLTNLEEYNKSKCAKYWPEKILDFKQFGDITVKFIAEKKLGDYLVRNLDIFKRNSGNEEEEERRQITQYHYLVWKDFMAPEHPHGIIKFIRHINAVYSVQRGPILVHCSAGVGRTGTLVALDSLMQQLEEEDQVAIFNTVCDLRHQRNFLVQSLKQYIFLYRALLDTAHFGNTELSAISLSNTVENLKTKANDGKDKCKLEVEFEKLLTVADETNKSCSVGSNEENVIKNRSESVIPYDRNRVILAPLPMKDNSTYINASFIEGYENSETFIIAQDPMENTIGDFWRMVSEQSISTLVMISEIGDGNRKCPRYWADDEIQYDHIVVKYMQSESCPYYTRREFNVTNCKIDDTVKVTQFQYNGWPTVDGEVPEVCRGIIELVDQAQSHHNKNKNTGCKSPLTVHCSLGTDRSSIFVAMCILVQQLRTEKGIDICSTARKIRSQRPKLLNTYAQYEFLHRAIANYADLHRLSADLAPEC
ncbi:tyrosine-protein phosphatase 69D isoform X2 [Teleopsis dalmanni]|uniref:tyrosine-protein phosphatase 69D isoform X2 n=1 Tax=Teleopsis dalmanni TaxID=139649 RepID=UPI0018CF4395|nr:tyrosine-protein phosphatase 69D isoform X2 [Teleopsis dalmanni]